MEDYFALLSADEVQKMIDELPKCQREIYEDIVKKNYSPRRALFVAKSYPANEDHYYYKGNMKFESEDYSTKVTNGQS